MAFHKSSTQNGLFLAVAMVVSALVTWFVDPAFYLTKKSFVLFFIFVLILAKAGKEAKAAQGGYITFGEAFKNMFVTGAIGVFFCTFFEYFMYNVIDPSLIDLQRDIALDSVETMKEMIGEGYEELFEQIEEGAEDQPIGTISTTIMQFITRLFAPAALMSAIIAIFIKKNNGINMDSLDDNSEKRYVVK